MSADEWTRTFHDAWREFYSFEHMRRILLAQDRETYWAVLKNLIWYRAAMMEGSHPMLTGFFRLKDRTSRRTTFPIERRWPFFRRRVREIARAVRGYLAILIQMQELWRLTRVRGDEAARRASRLNPVPPIRLEHDPVTAYWRRTRQAVARLQLWRLNPVTLACNFVRGTRQVLAFLVALSGERY